MSDTTSLPSSLLPSRYGYRGSGLSYIDPTVENVLPEVGQDKILDLLGSITGRSLSFGAALQPRSEQTLLDLLDTMDPTQDRARAAAGANSTLGAAREAGQTAASALASQGYSQSVQAGAQLDALNQGSSKAQDSLISTLSPENRAKRYLSMYQLMTAQQTPSVLSARSQGYTQEGQRRIIDKQSEGSGLFGDLVSILGAAGPYIGGR